MREVKPEHVDTKQGVEQEPQQFQPIHDESQPVLTQMFEVFKYRFKTMFDLMFNSFKQ